MSKIRGEPTLHDWVYENLSRSSCPDEDSSLAVKDHYKEVLACPICGEKPMIFWSDGEYLARGNNACFPGIARAVKLAKPDNQGRFQVSFSEG